MFKFLRKYSLILVISIIAGFLIGFKTLIFDNQPQDNMNTLQTPTPTLTSAPSPTPTPKPTIIPTPTISEQELNQILEELNIDPDNPTEEDLEKILEFLENGS